MYHVLLFAYFVLSGVAVPAQTVECYFFTQETGGCSDDDPSHTPSCNEMQDCRIITGNSPAYAECRSSFPLKEVDWTRKEKVYEELYYDEAELAPQGESNGYEGYTTPALCYTERECDCEVDGSTYTCKVKSNTPATESHNAVPVIDICTPCDGIW